MTVYQISVFLENRAGQLAGKRHEQNVTPLLEAGLKVFHIGGRWQQGRDRNRAGAHVVEVFLLFAAAPQVVKVFLSVQDIGPVHHGHVQFVHIAEGQVGIGVGHKHVGIHAYPPLGRSGPIGPISSE